ncbi:hypothetical protein B4065_1470 [Caldibacillus thermoamylovorans]|uniref:hypothetical protein n=1 Tax=Caldibacillus thermoamylovorans TaxID=35841 RepID=UPI0005A47062|nr:hypothetical protein [Caldibacillus thermoamylovorans]KIO69297.1 hypothetical protein B4065_1470 [Caldibacillus thermoamylovorans]
MENKQLNIYSLIGIETDPIYCMINNLKENDEKEVVDRLIIRKTPRYYEVESNEIHECFHDKMSCYSFLIKKLGKGHL